MGSGNVFIGRENRRIGEQQVTGRYLFTFHLQQVLVRVAFKTELEVEVAGDDEVTGLRLRADGFNPTDPDRLSWLETMKV